MNVLPEIKKQLKNPLHTRNSHLAVILFLYCKNTIF